jgi:hypothetical protein
MLTVYLLATFLFIRQVLSFKMESLFSCVFEFFYNVSATRLSASDFLTLGKPHDCYYVWLYLVKSAKG